MHDYASQFAIREYFVKPAAEDTRLGSAARKSDHIDKALLDDGPSFYESNLQALRQGLEYLHALARSNERRQPQSTEQSQLGERHTIGVVLRPLHRVTATQCSHLRFGQKLVIVECAPVNGIKHIQQSKQHALFATVAEAVAKHGLALLSDLGKACTHTRNIASKISLHWFVKIRIKQAHHVGMLQLRLIGITVVTGAIKEDADVNVALAFAAIREQFGVDAPNRCCGCHQRRSDHEVDILVHRQSPVFLLRSSSLRSISASSAGLNSAITRLPGVALSAA